MRTRRKVQVAALACALAGSAAAIGIAGVASGQSGDEPQVSDLAQMPASAKPYQASEVRTDLPTVGRAWMSTLPFDFTPSENDRFYTLWQEGTADCMQERGFDYEPIEYPPAADMVDLVNPLDRGYAEARGYHELPVEPINPNTYDDAVYAELEGTPTEPGCAAEGWPWSYGTIQEFIDKAEPVRNGLAQATVGFDTSDAGTQAAREWSSCMANKGHNYDRPEDPWREFNERQTIADEEISIRLTDLDCDTAVGYTQARHEWEQQRVDAWMEDNADDVNRLTDEKTGIGPQLDEFEAARAAQD